MLQSVYSCSAVQIKDVLRKMYDKSSLIPVYFMRPLRDKAGAGVCKQMRGAIGTSGLLSGKRLGGRHRVRSGSREIRNALLNHRLDRRMSGGFDLKFSALVQSPTVDRRATRSRWELPRRSGLGGRSKLQKFPPSEIALEDTNVGMLGK
jgi:hypothetical protein